MYIKRFLDISGNAAFYLLLVFLFLIHFSIAGCYIVLAVLSLLLLGRVFANRPWPKLPVFFWFFVLYAFFTLLSTVFSRDRLNSLKDNKELLLFLLIPLYFLILSSGRRVKISLQVVLLSTTLSALLGVVITLRNWPLSLDHRLKGLTSHWMTYAGLLMLPFIFFLVLVFLERNRRNALRYGASLALILSAIFFSLTRSIWIGIGASLLSFVFFFRRRWLIPMIVLTLILAALLPAPVKSRIASIVDMENRTNRDRFYMAYSAFRIFRDFPLFGVGANNILKTIGGNPRRYKHPQADQINMHLHNNFLQILAERGIFALLAFTLACGFVLVDLFRKIRSGNGPPRDLAIAVFFAFIGFLLTGLFEYNFGHSQIKFLLFYFLSLPFARLDGEANDSAQKNR